MSREVPDRHQVLEGRMHGDQRARRLTCRIGPGVDGHCPPVAGHADRGAVLPGGARRGSQRNLGAARRHRRLHLHGRGGLPPGVGRHRGTRRRCQCRGRGAGPPADPAPGGGGRGQAGRDEGQGRPA